LGWGGLEERAYLLDSQSAYRFGGGIGGRARRTSARTRDWSLPLVLYGCGGGSDGRAGCGGGGGGLCVIAAATAAAPAAVSAVLIA